MLLYVLRGRRERPLFKPVMRLMMAVLFTYAWHAHLNDSRTESAPSLSTGISSLRWSLPSYLPSLAADTTDRCLLLATHCLLRHGHL